MNSIETKELTKVFKTRTAVDALNLSVGEGEFFALLGQNGAGKTTTIRMLCCLTQPTSGEAYIMGKSVTKEPLEVKRLLNVSPQETAVATKLSVAENLELVGRQHGMSKAEAGERAAEMMAQFKLADRAKDRAKSLSGGMQRRLSIAMALITEPKVLFLDEPTLGLDVRARRELWSHIEALKGKITMVVTTHYLEEAEKYADRIAIMEAGRIVALGDAQEIVSVSGKENFEEAFLSYTTEVE